MEGFIKDDFWPGLILRY